MKDITCVVQARISSGMEYGYSPGDHRLDKKMILPFAGSNLVEVTLNKLLQCKNLKMEQIYLVACEKELTDIADRLGVQVYKRSKASICKGASDEELYKFVHDINADYFMQISPTNPLLNPKTIDDALETFENSDYKSLFAVIERKNYFFHKDGKLATEFLRDPSLIYTLDTKFVGALYEAGHSIYIWPADRVRNGQKRWDFSKDDPYLFPISDREGFDIDEKWQFEVAEAAYLNSVRDGTL